jgi:hypothetical protein
MNNKRKMKKKYRDDLKYPRGWAYVICKNCATLYKGLEYLSILVFLRGLGMNPLLILRDHCTK